jgi:4'-phosphopantetheinyl transferase
MAYTARFCPAFQSAIEGLRLPIRSEIPPHELLTATAVSLYTQRMSNADPLARVANESPFNTGLGQHVLALAAPAPGVALWLCHLDRASADIATLSPLLSAQEQARAERFGTALLRRRWIAGRATLRSLLGRTLEVDPAAVRLRRGVRGRPELDGDYAVDFNLSHTGDRALIAIATGMQDGTRVGIDIEREDRRVNADGLARKFLTERERAEIAPLASDARRQRFLRLWTCKEAMSKATGDALSAPFRHMDVTLAGGPRLAAGPMPYAPAAWQLVAAATPPGLIASLAIWRQS